MVEDSNPLLHGGHQLTRANDVGNRDKAILVCSRVPQGRQRTLAQVIETTETLLVGLGDLANVSGS